MKRIFLLLCVFMLVGIGRHVSAHSDLVQSEPAAGAQLADSPAEIRLTFSEPLAANSQILLLTEDFQPIEGLTPQFNSAVPEQIYTPLPLLEPGIYSVQWQVASADGHEISGSYSFSVGLVTPGAATVEPGLEATARPPEQASPSGVGWWLGLLIALAVGLPLLLLAARRAGRR